MTPTRTIYTALIGPYEELKDPTFITPGWEYVCYTDQLIASDVWKIVQIVPGPDPQRTARRIKILFHEYVTADHSIWVDASFRIQTDLNDWWNKYFHTPFTAPKHPVRNCIYSEIQSCIANGRGDARELLQQQAAYKAEGVPMMQDNIITSGILMRDRGGIALCEAWWQEMSKHSVRDQVAFARICGNFDWYKFMWDYSQSREFKHSKHFKHRQT